MTTPVPLIETLKEKKDFYSRTHWGAYLCSQVQLRRALEACYKDRLGLPPLPLPKLIEGAPLWIFAIEDEDSPFSIDALKDLKEEDLRKILLMRFWFCYQRAFRSETYVYWMKEFLKLLLKVDPKEAFNGWASLSALVPKRVTKEERDKCLAIVDENPRLQMLLYPLLEKKDQKRVLAHALKRNDPRALFTKAQTYKYGNAYWRRTMEKAAKLGDALACASWLAYLLETDPTSDEAKAWLLLCEEHPEGAPVWQASLAYSDKTSPHFNVAKSLAMAERAAKLGCPDAFYTAGLSQLEGFHDEDETINAQFEKTNPYRAAMGMVDMVAAAIFFYDSDNCVSEAANALAHAFLEGRFVASDPTLVAYLVAHAAVYEEAPEDARERGGENAWWLHTLYRDGFVFEKNDEEAFRWMMTAADRNHPDAIYNAGIAFELGLNVEKDQDQAMRAWFDAWSRFGHPLAAVKLGVAYQNGNGCEPNLKAAKFLFNSARTLGIEEDVMELLGMEPKKLVDVEAVEAPFPNV